MPRHLPAGLAALAFAFASGACDPLGTVPVDAAAGPDKDGQGKTIATSRFGPSGYVISCNGKDYDPIGAGCFAGFAGVMPGQGSDCQPGTCR